MKDRKCECACVGIEADTLQDAMKKLKGVGFYNITLNGEKVPVHPWHFATFTKALQKERYKVLVNAPAVVLFDTIENKKWVSRCNPEDTFDPEVGLMMCFVKKAGFNYHDFQELLASAKVIDKEPIKQRHAGIVEKSVFLIEKMKGYHKGQYLTDYDLDSGEDYWGPVAYTFTTEKEAQDVIDSLDLKYVDIVPFTAYGFEEPRINSMNIECNV